MFGGQLETGSVVNVKCPVRFFHPVKGVFFQPTALGNGLKFPLLGSDKIGLIVHNDTDQTVKVGAAFFGDFIE
jgi:hypothetical protein